MFSKRDKQKECIQIKFWIGRNAQKKKLNIYVVYASNTKKDCRLKLTRFVHFFVSLAGYSDEMLKI